MSKLTSFTFCFLGMSWLQQLLGCPGEDSNHCYPSFHWVLFIWSAFFRNPNFDALYYLHLLFFKALYSALTEERLFWKADTICCMFIAQCFVIYMDKYPCLKKWGKIPSRMFVSRHWQYWPDDDTGIPNMKLYFIFQVYSGFLKC